MALAGNFDIVLAYDSLTRGFILNRDDDGNVAWRPGSAPLLTPQQRTDDFSYSHIPPEIEVPLGFQDWSGGAGFEEIGSNETNALLVYNYTQGVDLSWGSRGYLSPELQTGGTVATTFPKKFVFSEELGLFAVNDRFVYKWTGSAWTERLDVGSGVTISDIAEYSNSNNTYILIGVAGDSYYHSSDGLTWTQIGTPGNVAFRSTNSAVTAGATSVTVTAPAGITDDDILIAHCLVGNSVGITPPAGFNLMTSVRNTSGAAYQFTTWWKRASSETGNYVFSWTSSVVAAAGVSAYSGAVASGNPIEATRVTSGTGTAVNLADITTSGINRMLVGLVGALYAGAVTPPGGYAERFDAFSSTTGGVEASDDELAAAGGSGTISATLTGGGGAERWAASLIAIIPAPSGSAAFDTARWGVRSNISGEPILWSIDSVGDMRNAVDPTTASSWTAADETQTGQENSTIIGVELVDNTFYIFRDTEIVSYDGTTVSTVYSSPTFKLATDAARPFLWVDGKIYFTYNSSLYSFNANNNVIAEVWPPTKGNTELNGTITSITGDEHNLYFAVKNIAGNTYVIKGDPRRSLLVGANDVVPFHTWVYRSTGDALAMLVMPADSDGLSSTNPHLVLGDDASADYFILPRAGFRPEDDSNYRFDTAIDRAAFGPYSDWGAKAFNKFLNRGVIVGDDMDSDDTITLHFQVPGRIELSTISSLVGYWPLGETSGDAIDQSTNSNDGTVTIGAGVRDAAALDVGGDGSIEFDGADTKIEIADNSAFQNVFDGGGSIAFMFNVGSDGEINGGTIIQKQTGSAGPGWRLFVMDEASSLLRIRFLMPWTISSGSWETERTIPINTTIVGVFTYDSDSADNHPTLYLWDGSAFSTRTSGNFLLKQGTIPSGTRVTDVGEDLFLGNRSNSDRTLDGRLDEIALFSDILTADEARDIILRTVAFVYATENGRTEAALVGEVEFQTLRWVLLFNNGANTTSPILQGAALHATLNPPRKRMWVFDVKLAADQGGLDTDTTGQDPRDMEAYLFTAMSKRVTMTDVDGTDRLVRVLNVEGVSAQDNAEMPITRVLTVTVVEI